MWHSIFIALHAAAGFISLVAGCVALRRGAFFSTYLWSMVGMALFLVLALAAEWTALDLAAQAPFAAFAVLAGVMVWRAVAARRMLPIGEDGPPAPYVNHIGFTLVALFDAFVVITVLNAGAPVWLVVASGVGVAVAGHFVLRAVRRRLVPAPRSAQRG